MSPLLLMVQGSCSEGAKRNDSQQQLEKGC
uniref:Uncharacterized protein n=1 Tax=Arundo donax TaxID=35708 RepID=A0A0A9B5R8_ARUDO